MAGLKDAWDHTKAALNTMDNHIKKVARWVWHGDINKPIIQDKTDENVEQNITQPLTVFQQKALDEQERQWEREDQIREHVEAREDSAWQRAVEDMRKAGVNPNLVNAGPAASGGGITSATGQDYTMQSAEFDRETQELITAIEQEFEMSENQKDRLTELFGKFLQAGGTIAGAGILKKK